MNELNILGQVIKGLYRSSDEDSWAILATDQSTFELRLGGLNRTKQEGVKELEIGLQVLDKTIRKVKTDDFALYFELESGECLIHSDTLVDGEGNSEFEFRLISKAEFEIERKDWYDSDAGLKELI